MRSPEVSSYEVFSCEYTFNDFLAGIVDTGKTSKKAWEGVKQDTSQASEPSKPAIVFRKRKPNPEKSIRKTENDWIEAWRTETVWRPEMEYEKWSQVIASLGSDIKGSMPKMNFCVLVQSTMPFLKVSEIFLEF